METKRVVSVETRAKMSAAKKGRVMSAETRAKMSAAKKGKVLSAETRAKMAKSHSARWASKRQFTKEIADRIRAEYNNFHNLSKEERENLVKVTYQSLAQKYGLSITYIWSILQNKIWV